MKILHVITDLSEGGTENMLLNLIHNDKNNIHIVVSLKKKREIGKKLEAKNISVYELNFNRYSKVFKIFFKFKNIIRECKPDIVQTWMYHANFIGGIMSKLLGVKKIVWNIRNSYLFSSSLSTKVVNLFSALLSYSIPNKIIYCSKLSKDLHIKHGYVKKYILIPNGYDFSLYYPEKNVINILNPKEKVFTKMSIGMVARWDKIKGHKLFIKAVSLLKNRNQFNFYLIGNGCSKENKELTKIIEDCGVSDLIQLCGHRNNMPKIYNSLDLTVLTSLSESFPNVLAESMACGTPCISSNTGEAENIIGKNGWILPVSNIHVLVKTIEEAIKEFEQKELWSQRKLNCVNYIQKNFSNDSMIAKYNSLWRLI